MVRKPSILHIHTDLKFIQSVSGFYGEEFENTIVVIGKNRNYEGAYKDSIQYYDYSRTDFRKVISLCETVNMVVLYDLNFAKAYIANRLPESVIVVWRFFGWELYIRIPEYVYSEKTLKILQQEENQRLYLKLKQRLKNYLVKIKYRAIATNEIDKATFSRTDFFLGLSKLEHEFLISIWKDLPPFLQLNAPPYLEINTLKRKKTNLVLLGNNRSAYNNHLDIIEGIIESRGRSKFDFVLMFNYGGDNTYTETVRKMASTVREIQILEDFLPFEKFKELYASADAFVLNGHRQMAMGNILEALQQNIKIYLNEKNIIYSWLKESGFAVFTIENFFSDLDSDNIALSDADIIVNQEQLVKFAAKHNKQVFQKRINEILNIASTSLN